MEKGALLPLRFYPATDWQDYHKISHDQNMAILREHQIFHPAFQLTLPDAGMHWGLADFTTIEIVNIETLATTDVSGGEFQTYSSAGEFRALVHFRTPKGGVRSTGRFYYHISDGQTHWYSEVFEMCNLDTDALSAAFDNETNFNQFSNAYNATAEFAGGHFCKTVSANRAEAYTAIDAFLGEEFDLYVLATNYTGPACGMANWDNTLFFELRTATGLVVSNTVEVAAVDTHSLTLISEAGGSLRLYMYLEDGVTSQGTIQVFFQRRYSEKNVQIRWSHPKNFCKIFYEDGYENVMFLNAKQVINENSIDTTEIEDDETNKYRIIGTNKKFNSLQIISGEAMLNAMSILRLHDDITIYKETGEPMDVDEITLEQSVKGYVESIINLIYRERSCSVEACGFEICCPSEGTAIMEDVIYSGIGNLPAAADWNGKYFIVEVPADEFQTYISNGAAWSATSPSFWKVAGSCVESRQNFNDIDYTPGRHSNRFFWYDTVTICWRLFIELASVADNADGTANVVSDTEYRDGLWLQAEYEDANGDWIKCSTTTQTTAGAGAQTHVCSCGVGTFNFRFHIWTDECDYGYSDWLPQTIT